MIFRGTIIEESLDDKSILKKCKIVSTRISPVTQKDATPWLQQWTLHTVKIEDGKAESFAKKLSHAIVQPKQGTFDSWYADFNDGKTVYIIFRKKVFKWTIGDKAGKGAAVDYGLSVGIPAHQLNWKRW